MASVLDRLASALGRNDERPNVELAEQLIEHPDVAAFGALLAALTGTKAIQHDAIKVLYEVAERRPELLTATAVTAFLGTIKSSDNRMVWGGMSGLAAMAVTLPNEIVKHLPVILAAADKGSVIAKDKLMTMLSVLARKGHPDVALPPLLERLETAAPNQFPMYAELAAAGVDAVHKPRLVAILDRYLAAGNVPPAKRRRVGKVLKLLRS